MMKPGGTITDPCMVVTELFRAAEARSRERTLLSLLNCWQFDGTLVLGHTEYEMAVEELFSFVGQLGGLHLPEEETLRPLVPKLQLLAYSQFWDALAVQRLLGSLARVASGAAYDPKLYQADPFRYRFCPTDNVIKDIRKAADGLSLAAFIDDVYDNQLRNAFVHSYYYFGPCGIHLLNVKGHSDLRVLALDEWDRVWQAVRSFMAHLSQERKAALHRFSEMAPIRVDLEELGRGFSVVYDTSRGRWLFG